MNRRGSRARLGFALLTIAFLYPTWTFVRSAMRSSSSRVELPFRDGQDLDVPIHVAIMGNFTASFEAAKGPGDCLLGLPDSSFPNPCANTPETLRFHFRMLDSSGNTVRGSYGMTLEGDFPDRQQEYGAFVGEASSGVEFLILQPLRPGDYHLQLKHVRVPAGLVSARPRLKVNEESNPYEALGELPLLLLSALLGLVAIILLILAALTRPARADTFQQLQ